MKTAYLCGKMRGVPLYNFPAFEAAEADLESKGWAIISPHRMDLELGFDPTKSLEHNGFDIRDCIRRDVEALLVADAVIVLPDHEASAGVAAELAIARWLDIPVYLYPSLEKFSQ